MKLQLPLDMERERALNQQKGDIIKNVLEIEESPRTNLPRPYTVAEAEKLENVPQLDTSKEHETNQMLKMKLLEFKTQTDENIQRAKNKIQVLGLKAESLEMQNQSLKKQLEEANKKLEELAVEKYKQSTEQYCVNIRDEVNSKKAKEYSAFLLARHGFQYWKKAILLIKKEKQIQSTLNIKRLTVAFHILKQLQLFSSLHKATTLRKQQNLLMRSFQSWRDRTIRNNLLKMKSVHLLKFRLCFKSLLGLKHHKLVQRKNLTDLNLAFKQETKILLKKAFKGLKLAVEMNRLNPKILFEQMKKATAHAVRKKKEKVISALALRRVRTLQFLQKLLLAEQYRNHKICFLSIRSWKKAVAKRILANHKVSLIKLLKGRKYLNKSFFFWQMFVHRHKKHGVEKVLVRKINTLHFWRQWKKVYCLNQKLQVQEKDAELFRGRVLLAQSWKGWEVSRTILKKDNLITKYIALKKEKILKSRAYGCWRFKYLSDTENRKEYIKLHYQCVEIVLFNIYYLYQLWCNCFECSFICIQNLIYHDINNICNIYSYYLQYYNNIKIIYQKYNKNIIFIFMYHISILYILLNIIYIIFNVM